MRALALLGLLLMGQTFALDGGQDNEKHALFAEPGTITDSLNFERSVEQGYRRIDGIIAFDGFETKEFVTVKFSFTIWWDNPLSLPIPNNVLPGFPNAPNGDIDELFQSFYPPVNFRVGSPSGPLVTKVTIVGGQQVVTPEAGGTNEGYALQVVGRVARNAVLENYTEIYLEDYEEFFVARGLDLAAFEANGAKFDVANYDPLVSTFDTNDKATYSVVGLTRTTEDDAEELANAVTAVPGRTDSDVHFTHLYKDDVYAARDLTAWFIETNGSASASTPPDEGDVLYIIGSGFSPIYATIVKADAPEGWGAGKRVRVLVKSNYGDPSYATAGANDVYIISRGGGDLGLMLGGFNGALGDFGSGFAMTDIGEVVGVTDDTEAALHRSSTAGWQEVPMLHEVRFRLGQSFMSALLGVNRESVVTGSTLLANTGVLQGGAAYSPDFRITSPSNALASDNTRTSGASVSATIPGGEFCALHITGFDTSGIPLNATITGIEVSIERQAGSTSNWVRDAVVCVSGVGSRVDPIYGYLSSLSADNKAASTVWNTSESTVVYGSATDLWGQPVLATQVKSPGFGVWLVVMRANNAGNYDATPEIDSIKVNVHYLNATSKVYFYNAVGSPVDVEADVVQVHLQTGAYADNDAEGILTVITGTVANNGRNVVTGDQIRTAAAGGGTLYATVSSPMFPVTLPSQNDLDDESSMYRCINANYFGSDEYESMYCANGAGPAFAYDRHHFIRIHPDLTSDLNKPRHLAQHGQMLALGFKNGSVFLSAIVLEQAQPFNFRGEDGAVEEPFSDKITGLVSMEKDVLGVFCESKVIGLRGLVPDSFDKTTIRASTGAIEYTVVDVGVVACMNSFGIDMITPTDVFGDFGPTPLSEKVWPWLRPRVQARPSDQTLKPKFGYAVRNKHQVRWPFGDGYALTLTLVGVQRDPQFTVQRWHYDDDNSNAIFVPRHISSGTDSRGVERVFAAMAYDDRWNLDGQQFVYEVDKLWFFTFWDADAETFNARPIQSHLVTNWTDEGSPGELKRFDRWIVFGRSQFPVTFQAGRSNNYTLTTDAAGDASPLINVAFGVSGEIVPPIAYNRMATVDMPIEGLNIALRFESNAADTPPFTLSAIKLISDQRGPSRGHLR